MAHADHAKRAKNREKEKIAERVEDGDIPEETADAILELADFEEGNKANSTIKNHLLHLRCTARRADKPLLDMDTADLNELFKSLKSGRHPDVKDDGITVKPYQATMRVFYRFHGVDSVDVEEIEMEEYEGRELLPDDLLFEDEVERLLNAARRADIRDMALIALMLATGQRLDAVRTLKLKHVRTDGPTMEIELNTDEGSLKGASGSKPLLWAKQYVRPWVESHPYADNPEAALFCVGHKPTRGVEDEQKTEPVSRTTFAKIIDRRVGDANIEKDVYPHLFRHTAITRMVLEGLSEQKIKQIVGWDPDSSQFGTYVHLADKMATDSVREELGLPTSDSGTPNVGAPPLERCPQCNDELKEGTERCPTCQTPLTNREAEEGEPKTSPQASIADQIKQAADRGELRKVEDALQAVQDVADDL